VILDVSSNVCPPVETLLRKQNLLPGKQKCFLPNPETFDVSLCCSPMFPSVCPLWETWRNIAVTVPVKKFQIEDMLNEIERYRDTAKGLNDSHTVNKNEIDPNYLRLVHTMNVPLVYWT
jgi:hypothetical protein